MTKETFLKEHRVMTNVIKGQPSVIIYKGYKCAVKDLPNALKIIPISKTWNIGEGAGESVLIEFPSKTTTMTKRYRLIRNIQHPIGNIKIKAGGIYKSDGRFYKCEEQGHDILNEYVENNPDWFTEIKEEKVEVYPMYAESFQMKPTYILRTSELVHDKLGAIKSAIEDVLKGNKNSWSDNDMIEFAIAALKRQNRAVEDKYVMGGHLEIYKNRTSCK